MTNKLPTIIVSGASGFIGSHFLNAAKDKYKIYAIARRTQEDAGIPPHENIKWFQCDISNWTSQKKLMIKIGREGGADYIYHLAGYYDFSMKDKQEYNLTNVIGTRYMLEMAKSLYVKRFIFASSLAACNFPKAGTVLTEQSRVDAVFPYAVSKRLGEDIVRENIDRVPSFIIRLPVIFGDWCQYEPLYRFLSVWLSKKWNSRILGGKGESAVSYIHVDELNRFIFLILEKSGSLPPFDVYIPSPDGSTSHKDLHLSATDYFFGKKIKPILVPKLAAYFGLLLRKVFGIFTHNPPFERLWMLKYLDLKLSVDSSYTRKSTGWIPSERYHVRRRLLYMVDRIKNNYDTWVSKNQFAYREFTLRANMLISGEMALLKEKLEKKIYYHITSSERSGKFIFSQKITEKELESEISTLYDLLMTAVQVKDRMILVDHLFDISALNYETGLKHDEICNVINAFNDIVVKELLSRPNLNDIKQEIHDQITVMLHIVANEIEDIYENLLKV